MSWLDLAALPTVGGVDAHVRAWQSAADEQTARSFT